MKSILDRYLDRVLIYANKSGLEAEAIRTELKDHLLQKMDDLVKSGLPREEATLEALRQHGAPKVIGYRLREAFPWIDIRSQGTARGVIAIGPRAVGIFAFGGMAIGVVACGGMAVGLVTAGGLALGLLLTWGGLAVGGIASGGVAVGVVAAGGLSVGMVAVGGTAFGMWVPYAQEVTSYYTRDNVPALLKSLGMLLHNLSFFYRFFILFLTLYIAAIMALNGVMWREAKRVTPEDDDWLING